MSVGGDGTRGADQALGVVDTDMIFLAKHRDGEINGLRGLRIGALAGLGLAAFDRPAGLTVHLPHLDRLPVLGDASRLDRRFLGLSVALLGRRSDRGSDDLTNHGEIAPFLKLSGEMGEEFVDCLGLHQALAEQQHRPRVQHSAV